MCLSVFKFLTGRMICKYDESLKVAQQLQRVRHPTNPPPLNFWSQVSLRRESFIRAPSHANTLVGFVCNLQSKNPLYHLDDIEFGRRFAMEKELDNTEGLPPQSVLFDDTGNFIIYPTIFGIKSTHSVSLLGLFVLTFVWAAHIHRANHG